MTNSNRTNNLSIFEELPTKRSHFIRKHDTRRYNNLYLYDNLSVWIIYRLKYLIIFWINSHFKNKDLYMWTKKNDKEEELEALRFILLKESRPILCRHP